MPKCLSVIPTQKKAFETFLCCICELNIFGFVDFSSDKSSNLKVPQWSFRNCDENFSLFYYTLWTIFFSSFRQIVYIYIHRYEYGHNNKCKNMNGHR